MSILIKDMEMPKNCFLCPLSFLQGERLFCVQTKEEVLRAKIDNNCPLIELQPHGDLIDKGVLKISLLGEEYGTNFPTVFNQIIKVVNSVPVVIESEGEQ